MSETTRDPGSYEDYVKWINQMNQRDPADVPSATLRAERPLRWAMSHDVPAGGLVNGSASGVLGLCAIAALPLRAGTLVELRGECVYPVD